MGTKKSTASSPSERNRITASLAVARAIELADAAGISAVTMRKLAESLGIEAMSLYHHVANKEALLDAMVDQIFAEIELPVIGGEWQGEMLRRARSAREVLLRHRWAIGLMDSRTSPGPATLRHHEAVVGCCRSAGFSVRQTAHAFAIIDSFLYGFVLQEVAIPVSEGSEVADVMDEIVPPETLAELPYLAELAEQVVTRPDYSFAASFEVGLALVLDGLGAQITSPP